METENRNVSQHKLTPEEQKLASAPIRKLILSYAIQSIVSLVIMSIYNVVDQIFIGNSVGYLGNGATNIIYPISLAATALSMLFANGGGAFFSLRLGERKYDDARRSIGSAVIMTAVITVLLVVFSYLFLEPICRLFGCTDEILPYALEYGRWVLPGIPFVSVIMAFSGFIRSDGSPKYSSATILTGAVLNTILDPLLIFVFHMGIKGAAIATVISQLAGFVITMFYIPRFKTVKLSIKDFVPDFKLVKKIVMLGFSSCVTQAAGIVLMALLNNAYVKYGALSKYGASIPLTAMGITAKLSQIINSFANGTAMGAQPIIGYNYGAGNIARVKQTYKTATFITVILMIIGSIIFEVFTKQVVNLFGSESDLYTEFAIYCIRVFMLILAFNGVQAGISNFFQAIGKPGRATLLSSLRQILLLLPAILILPLIFGLNGVVWACPVADLVSFFVSIAFMVDQWRKLDTDRLTI